MFESTIEDEDAWGRFHEWGNIQYLKGSEIINSRKWDYIDSWEDSVMGTHENIAWLGDNILYMGGDEILADKPMDEITISNTTPEILNYLSISFSKYSNITVFDFPAAAQVKVRVPIIKSWRNREGEIHWSLFYSGEARSKRGVTGNREAVQKTTSPNEVASLSLEIR